MRFFSNQPIANISIKIALNSVGEYRVDSKVGLAYNGAYSIEEVKKTRASLSITQVSTLVLECSPECPQQRPTSWAELGANLPLVMNLGINMEDPRYYKYDVPPLFGFGSFKMVEDAEDGSEPLSLNPVRLEIVLPKVAISEGLDIPVHFRYSYSGSGEYEWQSFGPSVSAVYNDERDETDVEIFTTISKLPAEAVLRGVNYKAEHLDAIRQSAVGFFLGLVGGLLLLLIETVRPPAAQRAFPNATESGNPKDSKRSRKYWKSTSIPYAPRPRNSDSAAGATRIGFKSRIGEIRRKEEDD